MSLKRYAAKRDANEPAIKEALEKIGASVTPLSDKDIPDLLVMYQGVVYLLEVKAPKTGRVQEGQKQFHATAANHGVTVHIVTEPQQAINAITGR